MTRRAHKATRSPVERWPLSSNVSIMGVTHLWDVRVFIYITRIFSFVTHSQVLQPAGRSRSFKNLVVSDGFESNASGRRAYRIGVDCSLWYQQVQTTKGHNKGENPLLRGLFFKVTALAQLPLVPVFVFDGRNRPKTKRGRCVSRFIQTCGFLSS